jgi:hypothetical protein
MFVVVIGIVGLTAWALLSTCPAPAAYVIDPVFLALAGMLLWSYFFCTTEPGGQLVPKQYSEGLQRLPVMTVISPTRVILIAY